MQRYKIFWKVRKFLRKKVKIIVFIGQVLRELAQFVALEGVCRYKLEK